MKVAGILKAIGARLLLALLGLLLALLIVEVSLRLLGNPFGFRVKGDRLLLPAHQRYTITNDANPKLDPVIIHTRNSLGFRGPEPPAGLADYLSIVAVGGSTTESYAIDDGKTWPDLLAGRLSKNFSRIWINNAGFSGHTTFGHTILVNDVLSQLRPKIVLLLVGANELGLMEISHYDRENLVQPDSLAGTLEWAALHSEVMALRLNLVRYWQSRHLAYAPGFADVTALPHLTLSAEEAEERLQPYRGAPLAAYQARLETLLRATRSAGIEPVLLTQPALYGDAVDPTTGVNLATIQFREGNGSTEWATLELYNNITRRVAREQAVFLIDLAQAMPKDSQYYYDPIHYTNSGSDQVARIIEAQLSPFLAERFPALATGLLAALAEDRPAASRRR